MLLKMRILTVVGVTTSGIEGEGSQKEETDCGMQGSSSELGGYCERGESRKSS